MRMLSTILAGAAAAVLLSASAQAQMTLQGFAPVSRRQARRARRHGADDRQGGGAANVGLNVQVYPGASLFKPNEQWNAMVNGQLDIALFPLDYASGKVPAFGATLMPGLIRSQDRAKRINSSQFMKDIRAEIEKNGVMVLSDAWFAGAMASKNGCITQAGGHEGLQVPLRRHHLRRRCGRPPAPRSSARRRMKSTTPSRPALINGTDTSLGTVPVDAALRSDRVPHRPAATTRCGSCMSPC